MPRVRAAGVLLAAFALTVVACAADPDADLADPAADATADAGATAPDPDAAAPVPAPDPSAAATPDPAPAPDPQPAPASAPEPEPEPGPTELLRIGDGLNPNSNFFWGLPYFPRLGQSFRLDAPITLTAFELHGMLVSYYEPGYWAQPEEVRRTGSLLSTTPGGEVRLDVGVRILRGDGPILAPVRPSALEVVAETRAPGPFRFAAPGDPILMELETPVDLAAGHHLLALEFLPTDPDLFELRLQGMHYGGETSRAGYSRTDGTIDCTFSPPADASPEGMALVQELEPIDGSGSPPAPGAPRDRYLEHRGKVGECTVIGRYLDIFNPGDLRLHLWGLPRD